MHKEKGIALVTTLTVLALILTILAVAYQTLITTTQTVQDRNFTLQAQYAAESGLAQARARVQTTYRLLSSLTAPSNKDSSYITQALRNACGKLLSYNVTDGSDSCTPTSATNIDSLITDFLIKPDFIPASKYTELGITNPTSYWQSVLKQSTFTTTVNTPQTPYTVTLSSQILIPRIKRIAYDAFEIYFDFKNASATATGTTDNRTTAQRSYGWENIMNPDDQKVVLESPSFSRWALFTDRQGAVEFDANTNFGGPVHTNGIFNFAGNSTFVGEVTSAGCNDQNPRVCKPRGNFDVGYQDPLEYNFDGARGDRGYRCTTSNSCYLSGTISNPYYNNSNRPRFLKGASWGTDQIPLPTSSAQKALAMDAGIYIPTNAESITLGILGDAQTIKVCTPSNTAYSGAAEKATSSDCQEFKVGPDRNLTMKVNGNYVNVSRNPSTNKYQQTSTPVQFNGNLYVDGYISRLRGNGNASSPDISRNGQLTITTKSSMRITDNITYEDPPCTVINNQGGANCDNMNSINVLGLYSETANVDIGYYNTSSYNLNAPSKIDLHASVMTAQGSFQVENYTRGSLQDYITVLGSVIQKQYGAFRQTTQAGATGYYRNFVYDKRMETSFSPPNFPKALNTWVTFTQGSAPRGLVKLK